MFEAIHQDDPGTGSGALFRARWLSLSKFLGRSISAALLVLSFWIVAGGKNDAFAVEGVRVCSLYGAGFYYIPGTDTCIKLGGYVQLAVGGGQSSFYEARSQDTFDFNRIRTGFDDVRTENRTANGLFLGGAAGVTSTSQYGVILDLKATALWSNTENRISINTSKVLDGLYLASASVGYSSPTLAGTNLPFIVSAGVGVGGATFGIKRDDGTDWATSFTVAAIADVKVQVYPGLHVGGEWIGYRANLAEFGRRSVGYNGNVGLLTITKDFWIPTASNN
jgi:hypothetical protein